jgi:hypothetical protein
MDLQLRNFKIDTKNPAFQYCEIHKRIHVGKGKIPIDYTCQIPQLQDSTQVGIIINHQIVNACEGLLSQRQHRSQQGTAQKQGNTRSTPLIVEAQYRITYHTDSHLCILLEEYENEGGAHGIPYRESLIFSTKTGERLRGAEIFEASVDTVRIEKEQAFLHEIDETPQLFWENAKQTIHEDLGASGDSFYLSQDGAVFYYAPYELAPYAVGYVEAIIPYDRLPLRTG